MIVTALIIVCVIAIAVIWITYKFRYEDGYYDARMEILDILFEERMKSKPGSDRFEGRIEAINDIETAMMEGHSNADGREN